MDSLNRMRSSPELFKKSISALLLVSAMLLCFESTGQTTPVDDGSAKTSVDNKTAPASKYPKVKFVTSQGEIILELYPDKAPKTVANFLQYVKEKHYDGTVFHRVINEFMIQGGGYDSKFQERKTHAPVVHEGRQALLLGGPRNVTGTISMARTGDPQSATAQFFINVKDNPSLDPVIIPPGDPVPSIEFNGRTYKNISRAQLEQAQQLFGYTVFGKVVSGMETVEKIKQLPTGSGGPFPTDVPKTTVLIQSATLVP